MGARISAPVAWGGYAAAWSLVAYKAGLSSAVRATLLGTLPVVLLLRFCPKALAPLTGLVPRIALDEATRLVRVQERDAYRKLRSKEGGESVEWLNVLLERMWPHIAEFGEKLILGLEATIQSKVPVPGGIRFNKCTLGKEPIRFGPVRHRVIPSYYGDKKLEEGGVELQIGVTYHSDVEIMLSTKFASVGVASLEITGTLSVLLAPLLSSAPFFGGVQVVFTNPPKVDLDFRGIGNVADLPGIYSTVRRLIDDAIARVMVTPNRIAHQIGMDPKVDLARLRNPPPEGVLSIRVVKAVNLEGKDIAVLSNPTSDPYVQVKVGGECFRTPTIRKTCDPVWSEDNTHEFVIYSSEQCVQVDVFDWDRIGADDPLGSVNHRIVRDFIAISGKGPQPWRLEAGSENEDPPPKDAQLFLEVGWFWLVHPLRGKELPGPCKYILTLKIDECIGLPHEGLADAFKVRCTIKFLNTSRETKAGWSKWRSTVTPRTLDNIRKLHRNGCSSSVIAEVGDVNVEVIDEFLKESEASTNNEEWLRKLSDNMHKRERCCNPQFEEVLLFKLNTCQVTAVVELVSSPVGKRKCEATSEVIGSFEVKLGDKEVLDGPFELRPPKDAPPAVAAALGGGQAKLVGTFTLWRLDVPSAENEQNRAEVGSPKGGQLSEVSPTDTASVGTSGAFSSITSVSTSSSTRTRKRDKFMFGLSKMMTTGHIGRSHSESLPESPSKAGQATSATSPTSSLFSSQVFPRRSNPTKVRQAVDLMQGARSKDILFGLGMLRGEKEWAQAQTVFRESVGGAAEGKDCLTAALEQQLPSEQDRAMAASMLSANGIGLGTWPPPLPRAHSSSLSGAISSVKAAVMR